MSKVSKDKKAEYNKRAYERRKAKRKEAPEEAPEEDNVLQSPQEEQYLEISHADYMEFKKWKNIQQDLQEVKKKKELSATF